MFTFLSSLSSFLLHMQKAAYSASVCIVFVLAIGTNYLHAAKSETKTTLSALSVIALRGTPVTLSVSVKTVSDAPVSPGQVVFCEAEAAHCLDDAVLGSAQLLGNGTATITLRPSVGRHRIYASFKGTQSFASSNSSSMAIEIFDRFQTSTSLAAMGGAGKFLMTATVTQQPRGLTKPPLSGYVSLYDIGKHAFIRTSPLSKPTYGIGVEIHNETLFSYVPTYILSADFNNDGFPDLAVLGGGPGVEIDLGDTAHPGKFLPASSYAVPNIGGVMTIGDFNSDGLLDLAVASGTGVDVLFGDPASPGKFQPGTLYSAPGSNFLATGDFNGDGLPDIVSVDNRDGAIIVFPNDITHPGKFLTTASYPAGSDLGSAVVADFNGDSVLDIAIASHSGTANILLGDPAHPGKFLAPASYPCGGSADGIAAGDFNKDGLPDIAVTNIGWQNIGVLLNDATHPGQLLPVVLSLVYDEIDPGQTNNIAVGDFNQDGMLDVAAGNPSNLGLLLGDPDHPGQFKPEVVECCAGNSEGAALSAFSAVKLDSDEAPVLFATQNAGDTATIIQTWRTYGTETATATFNNIAVPDLASTYFKATYWGAIYYDHSESTPTNPNAPTISNIQASKAGDTTATITWTTNVKSIGIVSYHDYTGLEIYTPWTEPATTQHSVVLSNLTIWSIYRFHVRAIVFFPDGTHWTTISPEQVLLQVP